jgi:hypothetical protein
MGEDVALKIMESELSEGQWDEELLKSFISIKSNNTA